MPITSIPEWMSELDDEDLSFIRNFILASGSLKEIANHYGVTYPTVRLRLDRLIQKIQITQSVGNDRFIALVKKLAIDEKLDVDTAKTLISAYKETRKEESND